MSSNECECELTMVEQAESTIRGRLRMAHARLEGAQGAYDDAIAEGRDVDAVSTRRRKPCTHCAQQMAAAISAIGEGITRGIGKDVHIHVPADVMRRLGL